ncbi:hypothetical protein [Streptomyces brevispora]|uniref:hypothetical protein n=1 Tax=Streptomyces brevispora TaxID=887462 RepID=UPI00380C4A58
MPLWIRGLVAGMGAVLSREQCPHRADKTGQHEEGSRAAASTRNSRDVATTGSAPFTVDIPAGLQHLPYAKEPDLMPSNGTPLDPVALIATLEAACVAIDDGDGLYLAFDDLVDYIRSHLSDEELAQLAKEPTDPHLKAGDVILHNGDPATVRGINFHAPNKHPGSGLPRHRPVTEIITSRGSLYFALVPDA